MAAEKKVTTNTTGTGNANNGPTIVLPFALIDYGTSVSSGADQNPRVPHKPDGSIPKIFDEPLTNGLD